MQSKTDLIILLFLFFALSACKKEYAFVTIAEGAEISCEEQPAEYYFEGFINGEKICFQDGFDDYSMTYSRWVGVTSGTTIDLDPTNDIGAAWGAFTIRPGFIESGPRLGKSPYGAQYIEIYSPEFPVETSKKEILDELIQNEELTIFEEEKTEDDKLASTYNFRWTIMGNEGTETAERHGFIQSSGGPQPNAYLRITELETEEYDDRVFYTMTLEMACDLYIGGIASRHYGRLEDGKMRLAFSLNKE
jgi:hypothetical protein